MYVYERMKSSVPTVYPEQTLSKAYQIIKEQNVSHIPVINKDGILTGMITDRLIAEVNPAKSTSLSGYEINFLLSKTKVQDIMHTGMLKIHKNKSIEEAALLMKENHIDCLPVVSGNSRLEGIITKNDVFKAFIKIYGINISGVIIKIKPSKDNNMSACDCLSQISEIMSKQKINPLHINASFVSNTYEISIKTDSENISDFTEVLKNKNFEVLS